MLSPCTPRKGNDLASKKKSDDLQPSTVPRRDVEAGDDGGVDGGVLEIGPDPEGAERRGVHEIDQYPERAGGGGDALGTGNIRNRS